MNQEAQLITIAFIRLSSWQAALLPRWRIRTRRLSGREMRQVFPIDVRAVETMTTSGMNDLLLRFVVWATRFAVLPLDCAAPDGTICRPTCVAALQRTPARQGVHACRACR